MKILNGLRNWFMHDFPLFLVGCDKCDSCRNRILLDEVVNWNKDLDKFHCVSCGGHPE